MSHPLIVDAAESLFVPACVYNNTKGDADERVLKSFGERAWNNPVVRIMEHDRTELVDKVANRWTVGALADGMVRALSKAEKSVPGWLRLLVDEERAHARGVETAIFGMG